MNDSSIQLKAEKGGAIRKAGFLTGIHALPLKAKNRLDEMLLCRYSPEKALAKLDQEYPDIKLPTRSSVYSYKERYLPTSLTSVRQLSQIAEKLDVEKMDTASLFVSHLRRFIAVDLNVLKERWYQGLGANQTGATEKRSVTEAGKMYMEGIKLGMEMLTKLNVELNEVIRKQEKEPEQKADTRTEHQKRIDAVLYMKYLYESKLYGSQLSESQEKLVDLFERRGRIELAYLRMRDDKELFELGKQVQNPSATTTQPLSNSGN